ncbi:M15 family metallopeptidase [Kocuria sp. ZOR0020]|uniref:M15 family metallopeptidase n=1 Tax=Kocuria sp. ZOR0020 TaxID=1339234 RepID=UPI000647760D|nr:M15 family metallopeptidase [Kocuria sp. ZOR0020]
MNRGLTISALPLCAALFLTGCGEGSEPGPQASAELMATESADPASAQASPQGADAEPRTDSSSGVDITSAGSLTVMVNKHNPLDPQSYVPADLQEIESHQLRAEAAGAAQNMLRDMRADGIDVTITSAYRSYDTQVSTYDHWVQQNGQVTADRVSARPGFSEHQTGLALDLADGTGCDLQACFADTEAAQWAVENADQYGFVLRFPEGQESVTGYTYEPWHFRYVGPDQAQAYQSSSASTLEEFYGTGPAPDYE